jgi:hypothetical protein
MGFIVQYRVYLSLVKLQASMISDTIPLIEMQWK